MKGKYADFYWSVSSTKNGYVWKVYRDWKKGSEVLDQSISSEFEDERYFKKAKDAMYAAKETIRDYHSD